MKKPSNFPLISHYSWVKSQKIAPKKSPTPKESPVVHLVISKATIHSWPCSRAELSSSRGDTEICYLENNNFYR